MKLDEIRKHRADIITPHRTLFLSGNLNSLPGSQSLIRGTLFLLCFPADFLLPAFHSRTCLMHTEDRRKNVFHLFPLHNPVDESMLQQELGFLESFRKLLSDGLLDDSWPRKSD